MVLGTALARIATEFFIYFSINMDFWSSLGLDVIVTFYALTVGVPIGFMFGILVGLIKSNILLYKARRNVSSTDF